MSAYSYELNMEYEYFFLITIPTTSLFFKKYPPKVFHLDNFCTFVLFPAGLLLATGGWETDIYLRRLLTLCFDIVRISLILNLSRNNGNGECLR